MQGGTATTVAKGLLNNSYLARPMSDGRYGIVSASSPNTPIAYLPQSVMRTFGGAQPTAAPGTPARPAPQQTTTNPATGVLAPRPYVPPPGSQQQPPQVPG
jgi:hypothetical protein